MPEQRLQRTREAYSGHSADSVTRLTVVDDDAGGRVYERWNVRLTLLYQDNGRTLKVFVEPR